MCIMHEQTMNISSTHASFTSTKPTLTRRHFHLKIRYVSDCVHSCHNELTCALYHTATHTKSHTIHTFAGFIQIIIHSFSHPLRFKPIHGTQCDNNVIRSLTHIPGTLHTHTHRHAYIHTVSSAQVFLTPQHRATLCRSLYHGRPAYISTQTYVINTTTPRTYTLHDTNELHEHDTHQNITIHITHTRAHAKIYTTQIADVSTDSTQHTPQKRTKQVRGVT